MWAANRWKDYELLDCGLGEKLERWGDHLLVRPDPQAIWNTPRTHPGWKKNAGWWRRRMEKQVHAPALDRVLWAADL